jgi:hypothetical protein
VFKHVTEGDTTRLNVFTVSGHNSFMANTARSLRERASPIRQNFQTSSYTGGKQRTTSSGSAPALRNAWVGTAAEQTKLSPCRSSISPNAPLSAPWPRVTMPM